MIRFTSRYGALAQIATAPIARPTHALADSPVKTTSHYWGFTSIYAPPAEDGTPHVAHHTRSAMPMISAPARSKTPLSP